MVFWEMWGAFVFYYLWVSCFSLEMPLRIYLKGKFNRVVIPLIIWTIIYAVTEYVGNNPILLGGDILNEGSAHLWFIYVVMGLYLIVPLLNPFMAIVSRKVLNSIC